LPVGTLRVPPPEGGEGERSRGVAELERLPKSVGWAPPPERRNSDGLGGTGRVARDSDSEDGRIRSCDSKAHGSGRLPATLEELLDDPRHVGPGNLPVRWQGRKALRVEPAVGALRLPDGDHGPRRLG